MSIDYKTEYYQKIKPYYSDFDKESEFWEMNYLDRWFDVLNFLPEEKLLGARVLDVGCGMGRALSYYRRFGADGLGVEPSDVAAEVARQRGVKVIKKHFNEVEVNEKFDVIQFEQVLSHLSDYESALKKAYGLLEDQGVLIVEEPNDYNVLQMRLEPKLGAFWVTPDHVNYFNFETMKEALRKAGFVVVKKSCTWPMELFELAGRHYVGDELAGKRLHDDLAVMLKEMGSKARDKVFSAFAEAGIGRDIVMFAKKGVC